MHALVFFIAATLFLLHIPCGAQTVSPEDQQKINAINTWMQQEIQQGRMPTPAQMDSITRVVNEKVSIISATPASTTPLLKGVTRITVQCNAGGSLVVPKKKMWTVQRVFVTKGVGASYQVLVTSVLYDKPLHAGEKLTAPTWSAEGTLLTSDASETSYTFEIAESGKR